jgi:hypothetical protein
MFKPDAATQAAGPTPVMAGSPLQTHGPQYPGIDVVLGGPESKAVPQILR